MNYSILCWGELFCILFATWNVTQLGHIFDQEIFIQGETQAISFICECPVVIRKLHIQFQGGFAGKDCKLVIQPVDCGETVNVDFYPEDVNQMQISFHSFIFISLP